MDVCGEGRQVMRAKMLELAKLADVETVFGQASLDRALALTDTLAARVKAHAVRPTTFRRIRVEVNANCSRLR